MECAFFRERNIEKTLYRGKNSSGLYQKQPGGAFLRPRRSAGRRETCRDRSAARTHLQTPNGKRRHARLHSLTWPLAVLLGMSSPGVSGSVESDPAALVDRMKDAYRGVRDYRADVTVRVHHAARPDEIKKFSYAFLKADRIRIDFRKPHDGWTLIYPDKHGEVAVYPAGWLGFMDLHLAPDNPFLVNASGQRINETDLGLLIENIGRSLTTGRRGPVKMSREANILDIQVTADDHFRKEVATRYVFHIDEDFRLPVGVEEYTPEGVLKREVSFHRLETNIGLPESYFRPKR
jgi:outer membrane lipoprotein-sorting protein